MHKTDFLFSST